MTREEIEELKGLAASMGLYDDKNPCKRAVILGKAIKELEQESCVTPQKRGKWLHDGSRWKDRYICSECGYKLFDEPTRSCPNCDTKINAILFDRYLSPKELKERRSRFERGK